MLGPRERRRPRGPRRSQDSELSVCGIGFRLREALGSGYSSWGVRGTTSELRLGSLEQRLEGVGFQL